MNMSMTSTTAATSLPFEVWFESLFNSGRGLAFPCDEAGLVDINSLSERGRSNYLFARSMLGREYAMPRVVRRDGSRLH